MKKILLLTDSLSLPRSKPELCIYEDTWPALLNPGYKVHQVAIGGATITRLVEQITYHKQFNPEVVILQSGIVDCAPRALSKFEIELMNRFSFLKKNVEPYVHKRRVKIRKKRKITYTSLKEYIENLRIIQSSFPKVFALGIVPSNDGFEKIIPGVSNNILLYNQALQDVFKDDLISLGSIPTSGVMSDYTHLNKEGHLYIHDLIEQKLRKEFN